MAGAGNGGEPVAMGGIGGAPPLVTAGEGGVMLVAMGGIPGEGGTPGGGEGGAPEALPPIDCSTIAFADQHLEDAIKNALDTSGVIVPADIASLTALDARGYQIAGLGGIECFTELTDVDFGLGGGTSTIANLEPLRYLRKLQVVNLSNNPLTDLSPLAQLPLLETLDLRNSLNGNDLSPLAKAPSLKTLTLRNTTLGNLTPLGSISTLEDLDLTSAQLSQPATLSALKNVTQLTLSNVLSDATPLATLTQLEHLDVGNKALSNFDKLAPLVNLTWLHAESASITSATAVTNMKKLTELDFAFNDIVDISPLQGLTQLQNLYLNFNPVTDLAPLVNNAGIGSGDNLILSGTSLNCQAQAANVTALLGRVASMYSPCN
jgi:Leucine-rich repeat (LRR) protein